MTGRPSHRLLRIAVTLTVAGVLIVLALLVRQTPWTLTAFMFVGQPLLAVAFVLFVWEVVQDVRRSGLF
jgi:hypothetical protein